MPDTTYGQQVKQEIRNWFGYLSFTRDFVEEKGNEAPANLKSFANSALKSYSLGAQVAVQNEFRFVFNSKMGLPVPDTAFSKTTMINFVDEIVVGDGLTDLLERLFGYALRPNAPLLPKDVQSAPLSEFDLVAMRRHLADCVPPDFLPPELDGGQTVSQSVASILGAAAGSA